MNPIINHIHQHSSIRKYKSDPVSKESIEAIVIAGQRAATSSNLQMYSVVATTDPHDRKLIASFCGNQSHIITAPVFMTWCADLSRLERVCLELGYDHQAGYVENFLLAVVDAAIAAQNAALAAESLGLGFCYIGAIRNHPKEVSNLLDLPRLVFPLVGMTLGWPDTESKIRPRLPLEAVLSWDTYKFDGEDVFLNAYDQEMIRTGVYKNRQVTPGDQIPEPEYGWTEHSARRVSKVARPHLRGILADIGFELK